MNTLLFNEDYLISGPQYASILNNSVIPALKKRQEDKTVSGKGGIPLFCSLFHADQPIGTVLVLHGFTENSFKYSELIWSLLMNRFDVIAYDQRGHGRSWRAAGISDSSVTHVDHFEDYVEDLKIVCDTFRGSFPKPWRVFAHSMGGAVAALYLEKYPETFSVAALCSPMIAPYTFGAPAFLTGAITGTACLLGCGRHRPFFMRPYSGPEDFETSNATDHARFSWYDDVKSSHEEFRNSVPTYRWSYEAICVTGKILRRGAPESVSCPVLLSTAEKDTSVLPEPQEQFIRRVPNGKHLFVKGARHEIFRSLNDVLFPWWHENLIFLKEGASL